MKQISNNKQILFGAILSYGGIVIYILVGLLYTPWMIRIIGRTDYGLYTLAYSILAFFVFDFGLSTAVQRFVAKYLAEKEQDKVDDCLSSVCKLYLYIDIFIFVVLSVIFFLIPTIFPKLTLYQLGRLKVIYLLAGVFSIISFPFIPLNGILSAYEKFVQLKICDLLAKVLTVTINVLCLSIGGGLYALVLTNVMVGFFVIVIKYIIVKKETKISIHYNNSSKKEIKSLLSFSGWTTVVALCQRCIFNIAPSILGMFAGAGAIAVLGIAINLEGYTYIFAFAINGLFLPRISRILSNNGEILPLMIKVGRIQIFAMGVIIVGFIIIGKNFIQLWVGSGFEEAYMCTLLFICPAFFMLPSDIADQTLIASGKVKYRAYAYIIMAISNIVFSYLMTSVYGLIGLAFSIFLAYMIRTILLYYMYYSILSLNIVVFIRESFIKMFPGLFLSFILASILCKMTIFNGWFGLMFNGVIILLCYIASMFFVALNSKEKKLLKSIFGRICINRIK